MLYVPIIVKRCMDDFMPMLLLSITISTILAKFCNILNISIVCWIGTNATLW
jgi:hypothetical protein